MRIINKKYLLIILLIGVILTGVTFIKPNKEVQLDNVILKQEVNNKTMAMYVGRDNNYEEYNGNSFPKGYKLNQEKSKCIDNNGAEINNALQEENGSITLTSNKSSYCYLYFDEKENLSNICNDSTLQDCLATNKEQITTITNLNANQAGLYRYQGTRDIVDNNYICFGTSDKDTCIKDQDHYMYRILGITDDGKLKLIKNTAIREDNNKYFTWHNSNNSGEWNVSDLFKRLNGQHDILSNIFLESKEYPYLQNDTWLSKIENSDWYQGFISYYLSDSDANTIYQFESGKKETKYRELLEDGSTKEVVEKFSLLKNVKIGIMNMTDYNYANQKDGYNCYGAGLNCSQNWLHVFSNKKIEEHLMTHYGESRGNYASLLIYYNYSVTSDGYIMDGGITDTKIVRPVFYLTNSINLTGLGTIDSPYIIK